MSTQFYFERHGDWIDVQYHHISKDPDFDADFYQRFPVKKVLETLGKLNHNNGAIELKDGECNMTIYPKRTVTLLLESRYIEGVPISKIEQALLNDRIRVDVFDRPKSLQTA